jgi:hypothetical protein
MRGRERRIIWSPGENSFCVSPCYVLIADCYRHTLKVSLIPRDYYCEHGLDFVGRRAKSSI